MKCKLIDKEGYLKSHKNNAELIEAYFDKDLVVDVEIEDNIATLGEWCIIQVNEWKYFEKVEDAPKPNVYWCKKNKRYQVSLYPWKGVTLTDEHRARAAYSKVQEINARINK